MPKKKILAIVGPTAAGKSKVAVALAIKLNGEIISADSMQVYQGMDVGTDKPAQAERKKVKHHLIDVVSPAYNFSVAEYQQLARQAIKEIHRCHKLPILVGGSGLYVRAALDKLDFPQGNIESKTRHQLEKEAEQKGSEKLYQKLKKVDPKAASKIHPHNIRRLIRALEVIQLTGQPFSKYQERWKKRESIYDLSLIGLALPREELYARVDKRVEEMISRGFLEEVKNLVSCGYKEALTAKQALGYKQILEFLDRKSSWEETVKLIKQKTRHFAKRQMTWFKQDPRVFWVNASRKSVGKLCQEIITFWEEKSISFRN